MVWTSCRAWCCRRSTGCWNRRPSASPLTQREIYKATVAGNSTMIHLFLGLPPQSIRLSPFITAVNQPPPSRPASWV